MTVLDNRNLMADWHLQMRIFPPILGKHRELYASIQFF